MTNYEILVDDRPRKIEMRKAGKNSYAAKIDGEERTIELRAEMLNRKESLAIKVQGKTYTVQVPRIEHEKPVLIKVDGTPFSIVWKDSIRKQSVSVPEPSRLNQARKIASAKRPIAAAGAVTAPMTGKIVSVKVRKGDFVQKDQVLCIIEAMKMENEISASQAGTVQEINVSEGSPVSEGDTLLIIG